MTPAITATETSQAIASMPRLVQAAGPPSLVISMLGELRRAGLVFLGRIAPMQRLALTVLLGLSTAVVAAQQPNPRQQPGAPITLYAPEQHDLYDGRFVLAANRVYMVGG